jgi:hypothetical protein
MAIGDRKICLGFIFAPQTPLSSASKIKYSCLK